MRDGGLGAADAAMIAILCGGDPPARDAALWEGCAHRLVEEGLGGAALSALADRGAADAVPAMARRILEADLNMNRARQVILLNRFETLADRLAGEGITFLVHKGGAIAPLIYARVEDRPMVDVDLIIRPEDWEKVRDALDAWGYRMPRGAARTFWLENYYNIAVSSPEDPPASFDIHWNIAQEGRYRVRTAALFDRAVPYEWNGRRFFRMGNEDLLLSLFLHLAYHYFDARLIWLYDMKRVIGIWPIDWDRLGEIARRAGLASVVALNLAYLSRVFPGSIPEAAAPLARIGALRSALLRPLRAGHPLKFVRGTHSRPVHFVLGLLAIDRPIDAARFAADKIGRSVRWFGRAPRTR